MMGGLLADIRDLKYHDHNNHTSFFIGAMTWFPLFFHSIIMSLKNSEAGFGEPGLRESEAGRTKFLDKSIDELDPTKRDELLAMFRESMKVISCG